jgi:hypothetical protein
MYLSKEEREELSNLSKEVFGTRSRWQKMVERGSSELLTRKTIKEVANEAGDITHQETEEAILTTSGRQQFITKHHTIDSVREYMVSLKKQRDEIIAMINKQNEESKAKAEAEKAKAEQEQALMNVNSQGGGSAL